MTSRPWQLATAASVVTVVATAAFGFRDAGPEQIAAIDLDTVADTAVAPADAWAARTDRLELVTPQAALASWVSSVSSSSPASVASRGSTPSPASAVSAPSPASPDSRPSPDSPDSPDSGPSPDSVDSD